MTGGLILSNYKLLGFNYRGKYVRRKLSLSLWQTCSDYQGNYRSTKAT